jgi:DNA-binding CsgD family transcriptional regulator
MRVLLVGSAAERARLRAALTTAGISVGGEFDTLAEAQADGTDADALVVSDDWRARDRFAAEDVAYDEPLTPREIDVLELLTEGLPNKAIAERLGISDQTVKFHIASILGKLGVTNRTEAVRRALRRGLISL